MTTERTQAHKQLLAETHKLTELVVQENYTEAMEVVVSLTSLINHIQRIVERSSK